jgi:hypothetical protein
VSQSARKETCTETLTTTIKSAVVPCTFHLTGIVMSNGLLSAIPNSRSADMACKMYDSIRRRPWWAIRETYVSSPRSRPVFETLSLPGLTFISKQHKRI